MKIYADSVADIAVILLIISGAGALKQVFTDSGVSDEIAAMLQGGVSAEVVPLPVDGALGRNAALAGAVSGGVVLLPPGLVLDEPLGGDVLHDARHCLVVDGLVHVTHLHTPICCDG